MKKILFLVLILSTFTIAQQNVKFSAQIRPRFETDNKDFNTKNNSTTFTLLRSRFGVMVSPSENISGFVQVQDSRIFGEETSTTANMKNVDLHQAFLKLDNLFNLPIDFKVGRFELVYNNERLIGASNWGNTGRSFDGAILTWNNEKIKTDFFAIKEFEKNAVGDTNDQNMFGAFFDLKLINNYQIQPIFIWQKFIPSNNLNRLTTGAYIKGTLGNIVHEEEFYYQFGKMKSVKNYDIAAHFFAINIAYNFDAPSKPFLGLGLDYSSGDNVNDNKYKVFNTIYGTGHKFYGYMDYFTNLPVDTYNLGLNDLFIKGGLNLSTDFKASVFFHIFKSVEDYKLKNGSSTKSFGNEIDFLFNYNYSKSVVFESGLSFFSPGDIFKEKRGKDSSTWFYIMITATL
ncbi:MAG: alginate export family protein [Melioribacteraceae bacterium]|nr:alginate export family protein [Melioribacteraceae bacterium]